MREINEMAYRTFHFVYQSALGSEMFLANKIIQASFKYDIKEDIKHPLLTEKIDPYKEIFADKEAFIEKINSANNG